MSALQPLQRSRLASRWTLEDSLTRRSVNIAEIFRELPDRQEYEDYYLAILEPESLDHLAVRGTQMPMQLQSKCDTG